MNRRTKIVCTLGPASSSREQIAALIKAGMNVARINCSHGDWETRNRWIQWIRELSGPIGPVGILADLQGPKFRIGELQGSNLVLRVGEEVIVGPERGAAIPILQPEILKVMSVGDRLLLGDGDVEIKLKQLQGGNFVAGVLAGGVVKTKQGLTLVGKVFESDCLTPKDLADLDAAFAADVDFIALSYVHSGEDMRKLRRIVDQRNSEIKLCAKVETRAALKNLDDILSASDVIMVARGDLGLQMDIEDVPIAQKKIIAKCREASKPVITATQMLESMVVNSRPTRAEATDIANAILDGTDAVMLSGETAAGSYPVEAVQYMAKIAEKTETILNHEEFLSHFLVHHSQKINDVQAVSFSVANMANLTKPKAILTTTTSGQTPRLVSRFRPSAPILCATWNQKTQLQMSLVWGCEAIFVGLPSTTDEIIANAIDGFSRLKRLKSGDKVIVTAGVPAGIAGHTNMILNQIV